MGLPELFVSVLIVGVSGINLALPISAWHRSGDSRFLAIAASSGGLAALGLLWTWGAMPIAGPAWMVAPLPILLVVLLVTVLILLSTLLPSGGNRWTQRTS